MEVFSTLIVKLVPLYLIIAVGLCAGKFLHVQKDTIAKILIYIVAPVIVFHGVVTTQLNAGILLLPVIFFSVASILSLLFYKVASLWWSDSTRNILAFTSGTGNTGYYGLPVAVAIFGESVVGIVALSVLGMILYESTVGFFITARGHHTVEESIRKILRLPTVSAFIIGLSVNLSGIKLGQVYLDTAMLFRGTYTVLGMMIIGIAIADVPKLIVDLRFIAVTHFAKFIVWPIVIVAVIELDNLMFGIFQSEVKSVMILLSVVPLAANTVSLASLLNTQPAKAATAVLISTLIALIYIPIIVLLFIK